MSRRRYPESLFPALGCIPIPRSDFIPAGSSPGEPTALPFGPSLTQRTDGHLPQVGTQLSCLVS